MLDKSKSNSSSRDRSPAYPLIPLGTALERLVEFEAHFKRTAARPENVGKAWDVSAKAYAARITAALKYFGFLDYEQTENGRQIVISEDGRQYLRAQQQSVKQDVIKRAALRPPQIAKFWNEWGADRPADAACLDELVLKNGFSEAGAEGFLKVFDSTISYAGLGSSDKIAAESEENEEDERQVGNDEQHQKGEGSQSYKQIRLVRNPPKKGMKEDVYNFLDDSQLVIQYPVSLSAESLGELEDYVELFLRKMRRMVQASDAPSDELRDNELEE